MLLQHLQTWRPCPSEPPNPAVDKVTALAWSPDGVKLAVATVGRMIWLYDAQDGVQRDKFPTKPARKAAEEEEGGEKGTAPAGVAAAKATTALYVVKALAFSPDSTKLSVAQSDGGVYVYKLGAGWGQKKSISHKFLHDSPVTFLLWPPHLPVEDAQLIYGLADGAVVGAHLKSNKAEALASSSSLSKSYIVALALHPDGGSAVVSAHYDGSIWRHPLLSSSSASSSSPSRLLAQHTCAPFALAWTENAVVAAGNDQHVALYHPELGQALHVFDHSSSSMSSSVPCGEFTCAALAGPMLVLGNFDALYSYTAKTATHSTATTILEHVGVRRVPNLYSATALAWDAEGRRLAVGSFCGVMDVYTSKIALPSSLAQHQQQVHQQQQPSPLAFSPPSQPSPSVAPARSPAEQLFQDAKAMVFEKGIQLLQSQNQLEAAVDHAMVGKDFTYALKVCDLSLPQRLIGVHHQHARHLQQQGQYLQAEDAFLFAKAPRNAIDMYLSSPLRDYASARRLAERHEPSLLPTILEAQASALLQQPQPSHTITDKDAAKHSQAEALYLAAGQPERALNMYLEAQRWTEALRIAHWHLVHRLVDVVAVAEGGRAADVVGLVRSNSSSSSFQARPDDILSTVDSKDITPLRAAIMFLAQRQEWTNVWSMLDYQADKDKDKGKGIGQLHALRDDMVALRVQQVLGNQIPLSFPVLREALDILKAHGGPSVAHLELYQRLARSLLGGRSHKDEHKHYVALQFLLRDLRGVLFDVLRRNEQDGPKRRKSVKTVGANAASAAAAAPEDAGVVGATTTASKNKGDAPQEDDGSDKDEEFVQLFLSVHYTNILSDVSKLLGGSSIKNNSGDSTKKRPPIPSERLLLELACKVSLMLLRYSPACTSLDKAFYTAGTLVRRLAVLEAAEKGKYGGPNKHLAFLLLNRYVDLAEAIEDRMAAEEEKGGREGRREEKEEDKDGNDAQIDLKALAKCTALPQVMTPIPRQQYVEDELGREEIKAWVLSVCTDKRGSKVDPPSLPSPSEAQGTLFEGLYAPAPGGKGAKGGRGEEAWCVLTGYPLQESQQQKVGGGGGGGRDGVGGKEVYFANKEEWAVWVKAFKTCPWTGEKACIPTTSPKTGAHK